MTAPRQGRFPKLYRLKGPYAGQDRVLGGYQFVGGDLNVTLTEAEHTSLARLFWYYQAEEVKDDGKRNVQADRAGEVVGEAQSDGGGAEADPEAARDAGRHGEAEAIKQAVGLVPGGNGSETSVDGRIRLALLGLDPANESHWTSAGKPSLQAVEATLGSAVTRARVEAALPGFNRKGLS